MHIKIGERVLKRMTDDELDIIGYERSRIRSLDAISVSLIPLSVERIDTLRAAMERIDADGVRGTKTVIRDIDRWVKVVEEGSAGDARARTLKQFADLLAEYFRTVPGHRIYQQQDDQWLVFYINSIEYESESRSRDYYNPAHVNINCMYHLLGERESTSFRFENNDVDRRTVVAALNEAGLMAETEDLRAYYLTTKERYDKVFPSVGTQYTTEGFGISMEERRSYNRTRTPLMREGVPAKVVVDVVDESGKERTGRRGGYLNAGFWAQKKPAAIRRDTSDDIDNDDYDDPWGHQVVVQSPEVPIHPFCPVYHLNKHERFRVNVMDLKDYTFNKELGDNLVLPAITKNLVNVLIGQGRISFEDIIEGKGAGACVLLGGPPGVGKTLTAEVFAEATERPLYSVQAAQLGTSPDRIEQNLTQVLDRGSRWNAVVLLDEADVYIANRGVDIQQNAIVAAFLRILEHHTAALFMTTNRSDMVDDAIASRCIARIDYDMPTVADQMAIWEVLNELNGTGLTATQIGEIVRAHTNLSGRDIKQLLKLATLWMASRGGQVTPEAINFCKAFLPTRSYTAPALTDRVVLQHEADCIGPDCSCECWCHDAL